MKSLIFSIALIFICFSAFAQSQGVSMRATNGIGYGNTVINNLIGKAATGNLTNASGSRVAYLSDTNGLGGGSTYTNNSTGTPGTITGSGISTNLTNIALKDGQNNFSASNYFATLGGGAATITTVAASSISTTFTNQYVWADANGVLRGTNNGSGWTGIVASAISSGILSNVVTIPSVVSLSASGTNVTINTSLGNHFSLICATNVYFVQPSSLSPMQEIMIDVRMNGTGGWSVNFDTNYWKFPSGQVLTTTTNANSWSIVSAIVGQFATNVAVVQTLNFQ